MKIVKDTYNSGSLTELANDDTDDIEDVTYLTYSINNFIHLFDLKMSFSVSVVCQIVIT